MSKLTPSEVFLAQVEAFLARTGITPTAFGKLVLNDPSLVFDLRNGRRPSIDVCDKIMKYMAKNDRTFSLQDE